MLTLNNEIMKNFLTPLCVILLHLISVLAPGDVSGQSTPAPLKPAIQVDRISTINDGAVRIIKDRVSGNLMYITTDGNLYEVLQSGGTPHDTLLYTTTDHGVEYVQGMAVYDSTMYISGNNNSGTPLTFGIIVRGVLQPGGTRAWSVVMLTNPYQTADYFDHLFSGLVLTPDGDSILICSGARGDHGEVQDRYGLYPGLRNVPLTTNVYIIPTHDTLAVTLQNDSAWLASSGYLYAMGVRNTFDMAFDGKGHLFGVENSGDRDHNEEMNWLQRGHHYGFPWVMGDTDNPQQYPSFNPATDLLISHFSRSWRLGFWSNDPAFPPPPAGTFDPPIQNTGPDADKFRDETTGEVKDASDLGTTIGTFTAHRSPLGLVFDTDSLLHPAYKGDGFMLSWTKGLDSCGCTAVPDTGIGPFVDPSQDLIHLDLSFDSLAGNYTVASTRIVADFDHPVDAVMDSNIIYVIENGYGGTSGLFAVHMPVPVPCTSQITLNVTDPCIAGGTSVIASFAGSPPFEAQWYDTTGSQIHSASGIQNADTLNAALPGDYYILIQDSAGCVDSATFSISQPLQGDTLIATGTTCIGCNDGTIEIQYHGGAAPYSLTISPVAGTTSGNMFTGLPAGLYTVCVEDSNACTSCDTIQVSEDPTGIRNNLLPQLIIYPNPSEGYIQIRISSNAVPEGTLRITDATGRTYPYFGENSIPGMFHTILPPGFYSVEFESMNIVLRQKLLVIQ